MATATKRRYVALLRGINLGPRNRVPMARLRELCDETDATDVRTYIASGNVVFTSRLSAAAIGRRLEQAIEKEFRISISVVILTSQQLAAVIRRNPFSDAQPNSVYVAFAAGPIGKSDVDRLAKLEIQPEEVAVRGRLVYMHMPNGYGRSALAAEVSRVKVSTTRAQLADSWRLEGHGGRHGYDQRMKFHTTLKQGDKTATGIQIPNEVLEALGAGRKPPVKLTVNGYAYRSTVATVDGNFMVGFNADHRAASGIRGGDEIDVEIELDTEPRVVELPADLAAALEVDPKAKETFDKLSNSLKGYHVSQVTGAKTDETRQRRIEKSISVLREGRPR